MALTGRFLVVSSFNTFIQNITVHAYTYMYVTSLMNYSLFNIRYIKGRVVTNVVRTCDPTPLLYIFGNKICLNNIRYTWSIFLII